MPVRADCRAPVDNLAIRIKGRSGRPSSLVFAWHRRGKVREQNAYLTSSNGWSTWPRCARCGLRAQVSSSSPSSRRRLSPSSEVQLNLEIVPASGGRHDSYFKSSRCRNPMVFEILRIDMAIWHFSMAGRSACLPVARRVGPTSFYDIPRSRQDPKIGGSDDAEVVGDRIAHCRPIAGNGVA